MSLVEAVQVLFGRVRQRLVREPWERLAELEERMARAEAVASYWRDEAISAGEEPRVPWRVMAHPLACTLIALAGEETDPDQLGITAEEFRRRYPEALIRLQEE